MPDTADPTDGLTDPVGELDASKGPRRSTAAPGAGRRARGGEARPPAPEHR